MAGGNLRVAAGALALATCLSATAATGQAVVVRASGPSAAKYPMGTKLPAGSKVRLQSGDTLTLLDKAGSRVLKGSGEFAVDSKVMRDRALVGMLARSLSSPTAVRAGAVRGVTLPAPAGPAVSKSVWIADIDRGGKVCVPQGSGLYLWRGNNAARRLSWLGESEGGTMVRLLFPAGTSGIAWPSASLPVVAGRRYRIADDTAAEKATDFELVSLAPDSIPDAADALGALLLANGCTVQFEALADSLEKLAQQAPAEG